jgi:hypothetical protein
MFGLGLILAMFHLGTAQTIQVNVCGMPATPVITAPANGTITAIQDMEVDGTADANITVNILDNGQLAGSTTADGTGVFGTTIPLVSGSNSIVAQVGNPCNPTVDSTAVSVTYNAPIPPTPPTPPTPPPKKPATPATPAPKVVSVATNSNPATVLPEIAAPTATLSGKGLTLGITGTSNGLSTQPGNQSTAAKSFFLTGSTGLQANVAIVVNGKVVADVLSSSNGSFGVRIPLSVGKNTIRITATLGDKTVTKGLTITRKTDGIALGLTSIIIYTSLLLVVAFWVSFFFILAYRRRKRREEEERLAKEGMNNVPAHL